MAKATHTGECQVCSRRQKLPNNLVARHVYKIQDYIKGTCPGSGHLPYELSCSLIEKILPFVDAQIGDLWSEISFLEDRTGDTGYYHHHIGGGQYEWCPVQFVGYDGYRYNGVLKQHVLLAYKTPEENARFYDERYCSTVLKPRIQMLERYIRDQELRISNWELRDLEPT